jgi:hypothetical protein
MSFPSTLRGESQSGRLRDNTANALYPPTPELEAMSKGEAHPAYLNLWKMGADKRRLGSDCWSKPANEPSSGAPATTPTRSLYVE